MVYGCLYCARSYQKKLESLNFADSKTLKEEKREKLFENLKSDNSIGWAVDVIDPRELSATILKTRNKISLNEISHASAIGLVSRELDMGVLLTEVTRDQALRVWVPDETAENMTRNFGSGYPGDPETNAWLEHHKHSVFGFPTLVRFSCGTCTSYFKDIAPVLWESDEADGDDSSASGRKRQLKLSSTGFTPKRKSDEIESSGKGRCKFF